MTAPARNIWESAGRLKKIIFLTGALDSALSFLGADPFSAQALEHVLAMTDAAWSLAASHAGVPAPSATTKTAVEEIYRRRVEIRGCLSRIA